MAIGDFAKFSQYKNLIQSLPIDTNEEYIRSDQFLLDREPKKKLEIFYAPFEYVNEHAKVVIIGITPGYHQMKRAYSTVFNANQNIEDEEILRLVKNNSSFEGPMRKNLINMLDGLGLHTYLGISSTSDLFDESSYLVHTTSVIAYPVFYNGKNYSGSTPNMLKTDLLKKYILNCIAKELSKLENVLLIPLGVNVSNVLSFLCDNDLLKSNKILLGFPHPSGGNGHRHKQFAENKETMRKIIHEHFNNI